MKGRPEGEIPAIEFPKNEPDGFSHFQRLNVLLRL
jgi:hypothetical protein